MLVDKVIEAIQQLGSSPEDLEKDMDNSEKDDLEMFDPDELDDLITLDQFQLGYRKNVLACKVPQAILAPHKKGRTKKGDEEAPV